MTKTVKVYGRPKGKSRPRFANGHAYTPKATRDYEKMIGSEYLAQDGRKHTGEISLKVEAVFKIPKSWTKKKRWETIDTGKRPECRPDIDNIVKVAMDGLNGIAYDDDAQVVEISARKLYGLDFEGLLITVERLNG